MVTTTISTNRFSRGGDRGSAGGSHRGTSRGGGALRCGATALVLLLAATTKTAPCTGFSVHRETARWGGGVRRLAAAPHDNDNNHNHEASEAPPMDPDNWSLPEDWALLDQLPKFTVGGLEEGAPPCTFWAQLVAATPELAEKSPDQAWQRCQALSSSPSNATLVAPRFGPPPPLLTGWRVETGQGNNKAVGQLEDGRTVWVRYHCVGRLAGDPFSDSSSVSVLGLIPGGYLEAVGGRIYELGAPADPPAHRHHNDNDNWIAASFREQDPRELFPFRKDSPPERTPPQPGWFPAATTATVSALLASTVLSACIGYGAGLGIIADHHAGPPQPQEAAPLIHQRRAATTTTPRDALPSAAERRARTEYRILREERLLRTLENQLEKDKVELKAIRNLQQQQQDNDQGRLQP